MAIVKKGGLGIARKGTGLSALRNAKRNGERAKAGMEQLVLVLDASASMNDLVDGGPKYVRSEIGTKLRATRDAARSLIMSSRPGTEIAVVSFDTRGIVECEFSTSTKEVLMAIFAYKTRGGTEIWTGIKSALSQFDKRKRAADLRRIVLMTDGADHSERTEGFEDDQADRDHYVGRCRELGIIIDAVAFGAGANVEDLRSIANVTGGKAYEAKDAQELTRTFKQLEAGIRGLLPEGTK
jgi:Mg-chelatase subunit ChlD